jgi:hypothetical protein
VATFVLVALHPALPNEAGLAAVVIAGVNLLVFFAGYVLAIVLTRDALRQRGVFGWGGTLATMPVYWLLMSGAAWLALWQFITAPFHWNKTEHGLSRFQGARAKRLPGWRGFRWSLKRGTG